MNNKSSSLYTRLQRNSPRKLHIARVFHLLHRFSKKTTLIMNEKIGVIVPVYKTEKYVAECIESILAQTYTNFRLILIDDGTPDGAGAICDEYATKDPRITVIHQENAGVTRARARGVEEAADCEWITFVDSDDTIKKGALQIFSNNISKDYDIIVSHYSKYSTIKDTCIPAEEYLHYLFKEGNVVLAPWGKFFRYTLFNNGTFNIPRSIVIGEDLIMNIRIALNTTKEIKFIEHELYNYRETAMSTFHAHIRTPDNEHKIHTYKIAALPEVLKSKYMVDTIQLRFLRAKEFWSYKYCVDDMKNTMFYQELKKDIKKYRYKISIIDNIIFNSYSPIIRFIAINTKKLLNKINLLY